MPKLSAAFASGRLSYSKARAITRSATPENEKFFLQIAKFGTASHLAKLVRQYERVTTEQSQAQQVKRGLDYYDWQADTEREDEFEEVENAPAGAFSAALPSEGLMVW